MQARCRAEVERVVELAAKGRVEIDLPADWCRARIEGVASAKSRKGLAKKRGLLVVFAMLALVGGCDGNDDEADGGGARAQLVQELARYEGRTYSVACPDSVPSDEGRTCGVAKPGRAAPNLIWPEDRSWLVVSEVDFDSTLVGGRGELVEAIVASPKLEVWQAEPTTSLAEGADKVNVASEAG
jgi:hypothetical protein